MLHQSYIPANHLSSSSHQAVFPSLAHPATIWGFTLLHIASVQRIDKPFSIRHPASAFHQLHARTYVTFAQLKQSYRPTIYEPFTIQPTQISILQGQLTYQPSGGLRPVVYRITRSGPPTNKYSVRPPPSVCSRCCINSTAQSHSNHCPMNQ